MDHKFRINKRGLLAKFINAIKPLFYLLLFLFIPYNSYCQQQIEIFGEGMLSGIISTENEIPFWFYKNTSTRKVEYTNGAAYGKVGATYEFGKNSSLEGGISLMLRDGLENNFQRENLFLEYNNKWLRATIGAKERPIFYKGLSSTNGNMIWSNNARPMPGIILEASQPLKISKTFALDWGIAHYSLNNERYVKDVRVHYKRLKINIIINENNKFSLKMQHFAMWAGTSPEYGKLPSDFDAFFKVIFARKGNIDDPEGEARNTVGDHLGSYLLDYNLNTKLGMFSFYHEHLFEDGSGTRLSNFPDGVWGLTFSPERKKIISNFLYEYIDTTDQSGSSGISGRDGYFSSFLYKSGWTFEGNILGTPFITADNSIDLNENPSSINNNRVRAHHFGFMGNIKKIEWIFKTTISKSFGTYGASFQPTLENWYNYISLSYATDKFGIITIQGGADTSNLADTIIGGGLSYKYVF